MSGGGALGLCGISLRSWTPFFSCFLSPLLWFAFVLRGELRGERVWGELFELNLGGWDLLGFGGMDGGWGV